MSKVHTSAVKKSAPALALQCARRNVCHDVDRSGTGGVPCAFRIRAIIDRPAALSAGSIAAAGLLLVAHGSDDLLLVRELKLD